MENCADPKRPNSRASMDSTSLKTLQFSFGNLGLKNGEFDIDNVSATTPQVNRVSSSLPLNGSLTGVFPGSGLSNHMTLYNLTSQRQKDSMINNVNLFNGFSNGNPRLPSHPEAISTERNLLGNGFNISTANSSDVWNQQKINGIVPSPGNWIITLAMSEYGSKKLQDQLLKDPRIKSLIFKEVIEYIFQLMTNQYGRYLFKKLIELEDENQLRMIMEELTFSCGYIFDASIDRYGSYSIKKLIKVLEKSPLVTEVVKALCNKFWELMVNITGQYVILDA